MFEKRLAHRNAAMAPVALLLATVLLAAGECRAGAATAADLAAGFHRPPPEARPWVYWMWINGNLDGDGMTADLEAMRGAGIGGMIIMEVDVGIAAGPVKFLSPQWRRLFKGAVREAERLGLEITLNAGPGWTGSGGPWVKPEQSMQHLVASALQVSGPKTFRGTLPRPQPRAPHFVHAPLPPPVKAARDSFYRDVAVIAFPRVADAPRIADCDEKALYYRNPFTSQPGVKPYIRAPATYPDVPAAAVVRADRIVDLTGRLDPQGRLVWDVPAGDWTILRFGRASTGANTRPAPWGAIGFECDKLDAAALDAHFKTYIGGLLEELGGRPRTGRAGWTMLHIDSWEMGAQNWTAKFSDEFRRRRGYDPLRYLPALTGRIVDSLEISERFLWDLRLTAQELVLENHAGRLKELGRRHGFGLSIEPYDMNPCADLALGGVADVPMCEFWSRGYGFDSSFSCIEAASIAHTKGKPIVGAEAFTADHREAWRLHPGAMKAQADWAFAAGINRLVFHRYAHQPWSGRRPGMTMGPYGVHHERTQTWWPMAGAWHLYLSRCQYLLRRGVPVADICYLTPEGAPHVFRPPPSALEGPAPVKDRRGYNFDGCAPSTVLTRMAVRGGRLVLPEGTSYRVLVLPEVDRMTPRLLARVKELAEAGATVVGRPPVKAPGLTGYPDCDAKVRELAAALWGPEAREGEHQAGKGLVVVPRRAGPAAATERPADAGALHAARWIWHREGRPAVEAPVAKREFRRTLEFPRNGVPTSAWLLVTADNAFSVSVNGMRLGEGADFRWACAFQAAPLLRPGANVLRVTASNGGDAPNPAGLLGALLLRFADGRRTTVVTDRSWESARREGGPWQPALELGPWGMKPWGEIGLQASGSLYPPPYPDYKSVAGVLAGMGVPPDFETDGPIRYTHRREGKTDIYFVANRDDRRVETRCVFRAAGRRLELWHPVTGTIRRLPRFETDRGRTTVPLVFEPHESYFVFFRPAPAGEPRLEGGNFPRFRTVSSVPGPWTVRFDPNLGGPAQPVRFERLADWTRRPEEGIRHYAGAARYRTVFQAPSRPSSGPPERLFLDLGAVEVMARARLNGRDLGVVWHRPFRLDVTDALADGENTLEIEVVNLWPNRLIGDQAVPAERRVAWTTWSPYKADSRLLPSGLLGPVTLQAARVETKARQPAAKRPR